MVSKLAYAFLVCILVLLGSQSPVAADNQAIAQQTSGRAVVVFEGGGSAHAFTTSWDACNEGRPAYVQELVDSGFPVFTAPGYGNQYGSTFDRTGCPLQPPLEVQWNTTGYPTQAGQAGLGFLGYLNATYGYTTFDLIGYSYGGLVARATIAALKNQPPADSVAPGFSYARSAVDAGVTIPTLTTMNSPHLGSPTYDIASNPEKFMAPVAKVWGREFANAGVGLAVFESEGGAGAIHVLKTDGHAKPDPTSWDSQQVGALDGVAVTLMAGDYCGRNCGSAKTPPAAKPQGRLRTDGTVPVYSQLILPCTASCPKPPGSVYIPPGMLPDNVVRKVFPTVHSTFDSARLKLPTSLSVAKNPDAISYLKSTVVSAWQSASVPIPKTFQNHIAMTR
jgi:hypothetical protein